MLRKKRLLTEAEVYEQAFESMVYYFTKEAEAAVNTDRPEKSKIIPNAYKCPGFYLSYIRAICGNLSRKTEEVEYMDIYNNLHNNLLSILQEANKKLATQGMFIIAEGLTFYAGRIR